jgi:hypothetical protein
VFDAARVEVIGGVVGGVALAAVSLARLRLPRRASRANTARRPPNVARLTLRFGLVGLMHLK